MCYFENIWFDNCPAHFKPIVYRRFIDDTFLLLRTKDHIKKFKNYLNKEHKNMKFMSEIEENGSLLFLDIIISRENNKLVTSVYRKPICSSVFTNFESFVPDIHKLGQLKVCFTEVLHYAPVTETFLGKLKL